MQKNIVILLIGYCLYGCNYDSIQPERKIYIVGSSSDGKAAYWVNGELTILGDFGAGIDIAFSGDDVYILGVVGNQPVYWKNGQRYDIPCENCSLRKIVVVENDVHLVGFSGDYKPVYMINGNPTSESVYPNNVAGTRPGELYSIAVADGVIYIIGYVHYDGYEPPQSFLWSSTEGGKTIDEFSTPTGLAISGNDIYISGQVYQKANYPDSNVPAYHPGYWKNLAPVILSDPLLGGGTNCIVVSSTDVYTAGYFLQGPRPVAAYWKNGEQKTLGEITTMGEESEATGIAIDGPDVFVCGWIVTTSPPYYARKSIPGYWQNGTWVSLAIETANGSVGSAQAIAIRN